VKTLICLRAALQAANLAPLPAARRLCHVIPSLLCPLLRTQGDTFDEVKGKLEAQVKDYVHEALTVDRAHADDLLRRKAPLGQRLAYYLIWLGQAFLGRRAGRVRHAFEELVPVTA